MKFSIVLSTRRDVSALKPLFLFSDADAEIIIVDTEYNEVKQREISDIEHEYSHVVYVPPMEIESNVVGHMTETVYKRDLVRCHNTGFAFAEGEWIIKVDDCTNFHPNFFNVLREDIKNFGRQFPDNNFVIRPVKLEEWSGHKEWSKPPYLENVEPRFIRLGRDGIGGGLCVTLDQAVFPRSGIDFLNGNDERYDIGHGFEDVDLLQRFITAGYNVILDQELMSFQTGHLTRADPFNFSKLLYDFTLVEIVNGRYRAYNQYDISKIRSSMLEEKDKYILKKQDEIELNHSNLDTNPNYFVGDYPFDKFFSKDSLALNKTKIQSLKNKHLGEDLFILGNSPDITKSFIDKIRDKVTFASNGFIVMRDIWKYEPSYMVVTNQGTFDNHLRNMTPEFSMYEGGSVSDFFWNADKSQFILSDLVLKPVLLNIPCLRVEERKKFLDRHVHIGILNREELEPPYMIESTPSEGDICFDLSLGTFMCGTVITDLMLPLAVWMGFKNIYLKGCSGGAGHFYDVSPRHFWDEKHQNYIYHDLYSMFKKLLNERDINLFNLDKPSESEADFDHISKLKENPTKHDGHLWDGPIKHHILGKEPYIIEYKDIKEIL